MDNLIPSEKNNKNELVNSISRILYELPYLEYEAVNMLAKNVSTEYVTEFLINKKLEIEEKEGVFLESFIFDGQNIANYNFKDINEVVKKFFLKSEVSEYIEFINSKQNDKIIRQLQLQNITFEIHNEIIRQIKQNSLKNIKTPQLASMADKFLKMLHLELDKNKEDIKDGLQIIQDYYKTLKINPIITDDQGFNFYDVEFFGDETANNSKFITYKETKEDK